MLDQIDFHGMTAEELAGENGLHKKLTSRFYSKALDAEMDEHLGYKKNDNAGDNSGNSRNGYTTNAIESLNFSLRKVTRNKSSFPDDDSIYKVMYLAIKNALPPLDHVHQRLGTGSKSICNII